MDDRSLLYTELCNKTELYELHTHLLGMGNTDFWINTVLINRTILPTNDQFLGDADLRRRLGPLVWCQDRFVDRRQTANFFDHLRLHPDRSFDGDDAERKTLRNLDTRELRGEMKHRNLSYSDHFSYDVIISVDDLAKAFSLTNPNPDIVQTTLEEKLGVYKQATHTASPFKYWIIFNARKQKIEVVNGMTAEKLRELIGGDSAIEHIHNPAKRDARAHIVNGFSMCNADGTMPRSIDYHSFRGQFTPEFYPRRFALKDSLYKQRLDILALLLQHVLRRYQICSPPVKYCEFSVGVGDLSKAYIFDILCSFPSISDVANFNLGLRENIKTAFQDILEDFPRLASKIKNEVTYRFLVGFNRQLVSLDQDLNNDQNMKPKEQEKAIQLLAEAPQLAIHHMLNEIIRSDDNDDSKLFVNFTNQLTDFEEKVDKIPSYYDWVVGLDLFGDELGFPYCPFVAKEFLKHVETRRSKSNPNYGLRIHAGENVAVVNPALPGYHLFVAHMYIVLLGIEYLKEKLHYGIRVGHGIAFNIIFDYKGDTESSSRKSSVLMAEMKELSRKILQNIPLEVNITSNFYLLGDSVRRSGTGEQTQSLNSFFQTPRIPIVLSTDNDGIWPLDQCQLKHFGHHSLAAEYCRAIYSGMISTQEQLNNIIDDSKKYCFDKYLTAPFTDTTTSTIKIKDRFRNPMVALHPKLVRHILEKLYPGDNNMPFYRHCISMYPERLDNTYELSIEQCDNLAPIALAISYLTHAHWPDEYRAEYDSMFRDPQNRHYQKHCDVMEKCKRIYDGLMERSRDIDSADYSVSIKNNDNSAFVIRFMSMQSSDDDSKLQVLIDHVTNKDCNDSLIFGFCNKLDMKKTLAELVKKWKPPYPVAPKQNLIVSLHSNMNKYDYTNANTVTKITLTANYHPDIRTNCDDESEEHALYAICPHGSAATAALHHIANYERSPKTNDSDPKYLMPQYIRSIQSKKNGKTITTATSTKISVTTTTTRVSTSFYQFPDTRSYKTSCVVRPFDQLIIPFLPMRVSVPFADHSHFYELYNIENSSKLADKFEFQDASTLSHHIDEDYAMLFDDAVHSQMNWSALYKEFGDENVSDELIRAMLNMALVSLQQYDVCPSHFALLRTTPKRATLRDSLERQHLDILVPIKTIDKGSKLLICTQIQRFPFRTEDLKFPVTNQLSFDIAHILWMNVHRGKPFKHPHFELNNTIILYHMNELQEIARQLKQPADDIWGYFIVLTICETGNEAWDSTTVNKWCDFMNDALPNDERIGMFANFLSSHKLQETFRSMLKDQSRGKLGNQEQLNFIKKRKAYEIQQILLSRLDPRTITLDSKTVAHVSYTNTEDPPAYYNHLVVWLDSHIGLATNNVDMKTKIEKALQLPTVKPEDIIAEESISYMTPHVLYELKNEAYALKLFSDEEICFKFIQLHDTKNIFFITSGSLGKSIVPKIASLKQIYAIYIFCGNISYHESWTKKYPDHITAIFDHEENLLLRLREDVRNYLQEKGGSAWYKINENQKDLRNLSGEFPSIPNKDSSLGPCLSPPDYETTIAKMLQVE